MKPLTKHEIDSVPGLGDSLVDTLERLLSGSISTFLALANIEEVRKGKAGAFDKLKPKQPPKPK